MSGFVKITENEYYEYGYDDVFTTSVIRPKARFNPITLVWVIIGLVISAALLAPDMAASVLGVK